jgi:hypothetical protein
MMGPIQNVDFASPMLAELDTAAKELNVSCQAVIKTLIRQALDHHYLARARGASDFASLPERGISGLQTSFR